MKNTTFRILLLLLITLNSAFSQTFEKKFSGCWGDTDWDFEFYKTGKYKRMSAGHYGFTTVEGDYIIKKDSITLISGYEDTDGTVNEKYIIDNDSILIDLQLGYGYPLATKKYTDTNLTKYCDIQYPKIQSVNPETEKRVEEALNLAFNSEQLKQFYQFDKYPQRKIIVANYYKLNAKIQVGKHEIVFMPQDKIKDDFYLEFTEFGVSLPYQCYFEIKIPFKKATLFFIYRHENGQWKADKPIVRKK